jgi:lipopolysaccharide transport protein LptA
MRVFLACLSVLAYVGIHPADGTPESGMGPGENVQTAAVTRAVVVVPDVTGEVAGAAAVTGGVVVATGVPGQVEGSGAQSAGTGLVAVVASGDASTNRTVITSRQLLFDYRRSIAMFEGDVVVVDPHIRILSDRLIAVFGESNSVQTVTALDNVRLFSGDRQGTCGRAIYRVPAGEILLAGSPVLRRERDVLKGDRITFWTDREVVVCEPGQLILSPGSVKEKP